MPKPEKKTVLLFQTPLLEQVEELSKRYKYHPTSLKELKLLNNHPEREVWGIVDNTSNVHEQKVHCYIMVCLLPEAPAWISVEEFGFHPGTKDTFQYYQWAVNVIKWKVRRYQETNPINEVAWEVDEYDLPLQRVLAANQFLVQQEELKESDCHDLSFRRVFNICDTVPGPRFDYLKVIQNQSKTLDNQ